MIYANKNQSNRLHCIFFIVAGVTVNNHCPAAQVQKAADKIVDDIRANDKEAPERSIPAGYMRRYVKMVGSAAKGAVLS